MSFVNRTGRTRPLRAKSLEIHVDGRATEGTKPEDVGDQPLIRGFVALPYFVRGCPQSETRASIEMIGHTA